VYLHGVLGVTAEMIGWTVAGDSYAEVINDTLLAYGVADIAQAADVSKLRTLGRMCLWQMAKTAVIPEVNYSADGQNYSREAIFQHIDNMLSQARIDALPFYDTGYQMDMYGVSYDDPYAPIELLD
jgi:hypothetical protein